MEPVAPSGTLTGLVAAFGAALAVTLPLKPLLLMLAANSRSLKKPAELPVVRLVTKILLSEPLSVPVVKSAVSASEPFSPYSVLVVLSCAPPAMEP
ncbi:hypothetical protein GALL_543970 [mine drainage metagenome]|uniref:Uncharacterized protein n=1 Tax=mine drainage metagenome TaxID=410659 RepID=A0A1J5P0I2_9ZZZZ